MLRPADNAAGSFRNVESLVLIEDATVRDVVLVGLSNIPGVRAESPAGFPDVDRARRRPYESIFVDHNPNRGGSVNRLARLCELAPNAEIIVVAEERAARALQSERTKLKISGFLELPMDVREFFKLGVRLRKRFDTRKIHKT
ncbi:MAG: hypothetical protein ACKVS6_03420 [Planctomycetota bacterium]